VPVAIAIFARVVPPGQQTPLNRPAGGRCMLGALLGFAILALVIWSTSEFPPLPRNIISLLAHAGLVAFLLAFAAYVEPGQDILGFDRKNAPSDLLRGVGAYVAFVPVVVAAHVLNAYFVSDDVETVRKALHDMLAQEGLGRIALILNVVVAVPLFEEILFRGLLQQGIKAQLSLVTTPRATTALSVLLASIAFTTLHEPATYIPVFVLSLILGSSFERSGRILLPVALHATHNLAVVLLQAIPRPWGAGP
jgi:membrane protease YdiL (CAAX protease family)